MLTSHSRKRRCPKPLPCRVGNRFRGLNRTTDCSPSLRTCSISGLCRVRQPLLSAGQRQKQPFGGGVEHQLGIVRNSASGDIARSRTSTFVGVARLTGASPKVILSPEL